MKMNSYSRRETVIKVAFISLVLLLGGGLLASGAAASEDCAMNLPRHAHALGETSNLCMSCCNFGDAQCFCHGQQSQPVEMPIVVVVPGGGFRSDATIFTVTPLMTADGLPCVEGHSIFPFFKKVFTSPLLFLLNRSFII